MHASSPATDSSRSSRRWEPLTGIGFVVLFVAAMALLNPPNDNDSDKTWEDFYADHTHQVLTTLAGFLVVFAGLSLLAFLTCVWRRIRASRPGDTSPLPLLTATMAATAIGLAGLVGATITGAMTFGTLKEPGPDALRIVQEMSYPILFIGGMYPAALSVLVLGFQGHAAGIFARWVLILSCVAAVGLLAAVFFFPIILLLILVLVVTVLLLRAGSAPATSATPTPREAPSG